MLTRLITQPLHGHKAAVVQFVHDARHIASQQIHSYTHNYYCSQHAVAA